MRKMHRRELTISTGFCHTWKFFMGISLVIDEVPRSLLLTVSCTWSSSHLMRLSRIIVHIAYLHCMHE